MSFRFSFKNFILALLTLPIMGLLGAVPVNAQCEKGCNSSTQSTSDYLRCVDEEIGCWEGKVTETRQQANTLTNAINLLNGQISLQQLQVNQTLAEITQLEEEITDLSQRIEGLGYSLDRLGTVLIERVRTQYKQTRTAPALRLLGADTLSDLVTQMKYLVLAQRQTADTMERTEAQRLEYDEQKQLKEEKQISLESKRNILLAQRRELESKRAAQRQLLAETQNSEKIYQQELARTLSEYQAIQGIISGQGVESEAGSIKKGDKIASMIQGKSCNSGGTHLHFIVKKDNVVSNPFSFLKSGISFNNCSASPCGASYSDPFNPSGSWDWPLRETIKFNQGYGSTWATQNDRVWYDFHNGIDISSTGSQDVYSVADGALYRGSYTGNGSCRLPYVRVQHSTENASTYYLHVNY